ncbi:MAG: CYTH domain-containing protein [Spirochaetales bacterium]|nr:CYTH domain-containing protein [Spirochaetales bacterium]
MNHEEVELKLRLDKSSYQFFINNHATLETHEQRNFFMDTQAFDLVKTKWVFRLRDEGERAFMTLKGPSQIKKGVFSRPEFEEAISLFQLSAWQKGFFARSIDLGVLSKAPLNWPENEFHEYARFTNRRTVIEWQGYTLELDSFTIKDKQFYELECETTPDKLDKISQNLEKLFSKNGHNFRFSEKSKFRILMQELDLEQKLI